MSTFNDLLKFVEFTNRFREVERMVLVPGTDQNENDSEHSFQLAIVSWYLISSQGWDYDLDKIMKYALAHDLVETYAGDTYFHTVDQAAKDDKANREAMAAKRIAEEFPEFDELHEIIMNYEKKAEKEAWFVYALDKMLPVMDIYLDNGRSWHRDKVTYEMARTKDEKIKHCAEVMELWMEFVKILEERKDELFTQPANL